MPLSLPRWIARPARATDGLAGSPGAAYDGDDGGDVTALLVRLVDHAPSPTLVADDRRRVRFLNQAARTLLRRLEPSLATRFPGFAVDRLDGESIDLFFADLPDGAGLLEHLDGIHRLDLRLGTSRLRLKTTAVRAAGADGPLGFLLEWIDWAAEADPTDALTAVLRRAADGDLASRCGTLPPDVAVAEAARHLDRLVQACDELVGQLGTAMDRLGDGDVTVRVDVAGAGGFARVAARVNAAVERLDHRLGHLASATAQADRVGAAAGAEVAALVDAVAGFAGLADQVGAQVAAIDDVAFQTELLALNAEIEAAKAGAAGQGFEVVAQEVRRLSRRSAEATRGIRGLLDRAAQAAATGLRRASSTRRALDEARDTLAALAAGMDELRRSGAVPAGPSVAEPGGPQVVGGPAQAAPVGAPAIAPAALTHAATATATAAAA